MRTLRRLACSIVLGAALGACAGKPPEPLPLIEVARGAYGSIKVARREVIRDQVGWDRLRTEMDLHEVAVQIDFEGQMVIAAFMGERRTGGYAVEIVAVAVGDDELVVTVRETGPPPGAMTAQVLTAPFHLVRVARTTLPVRFEDEAAP